MTTLTLLPGVTQQLQWVPEGTADRPFAVALVLPRLVVLDEPLMVSGAGWGRVPLPPGNYDLVELRENPKRTYPYTVDLGVRVWAEQIERERVTLDCVDTPTVVIQRGECFDSYPELVNETVRARFTDLVAPYLTSYMYAMPPGQSVLLLDKPKETP